MPNSEPIETLANDLTAAGYGGLFLYGRQNEADAVWQQGQNRTYLEQIVNNGEYTLLARFLASEVLFEYVEDYPPVEWQELLAQIYTVALANSGGEDSLFNIAGNQWGFMYYLDDQGVDGAGPLGAHLMEAGEKALPFLIQILDNSDILYYEGSRDATLGNSLEYRVKDAAAYYIGKISGIPVNYYKHSTDRNAEIERLMEALKDYG